ncbi:alpha-amylase family glycosyl hydrolase [Niveibacterium sp. 24ML]|uniref:alpha-amylase family glycosyl hydrolase n=1 Tax=Niveibacterium sp. 24ML TaxID=2985512 RepID=UPI00227054CD|nr:alpha-amylase family glycosyl hydrolase [Niveibacterium sp. 24ML]MCX9157983.1 alpha-amylase family glycosyl hydrolase [Niveibacterium sp. 24ML]
MIKPIAALLLLGAASAPMTANADWFFRGTPNAWAATAMTAKGGNAFQTCQTFTSGDANGGPRFKIDRFGNWTEAYPGTDYGVSANTSYQIDFDSVSHAITVTKVASCGADIIPPTKPGTPVSGTVTATSVALTWTASTDNVGVVGYKVFRNGAEIGTASSAAYTDTTVSASTSYSYTVQAYDAVGALSPLSGALSVITPAAAPQWYFRGTANAWGKTQMTAMGGTRYQTCQYFAGGDAGGGARFKIDRYGDWTQAFPATDYTVASPKSYVIDFYSDTKAISATPVSSCGTLPPSESTTLGAEWSASKTVFSIWSPDKTDVKLVLDGVTYPMSRVADFNGYTDVYQKSVASDQRLKKYSFMINGVSVRDPYGKMAEPNTNNNIVMDLSRSALPAGWAPRPPLAAREDAVIYEMHVRDFTIAANSGVSVEKRGKFLGMVQGGTTLAGAKTGIDHLKELGVTHIQLLPVYDFGSCPIVTDTSCYNWGYDPRNFNVPEERYSLTPFDYENRVREFRQTVDEFHKAGIRVVMDVVYNHSFAKEMFEPITSKYYTPTDLSGTGNSIDADQPMVSRMIQDSLEYWAREYNLDGFRFDLIGIFSYAEVEKWANNLNAKFADRNLLIYGEPWNGFASDPKDAQRVRLGTVGRIWNSHVGVFNPKFRDAIKGANDSGACGAGDCYAFNTNPDTWRIEVGGRGAIRASKNAGTVIDTWDPMFAMDPEQTINYVSAHDNLALRDKILLWADANGVARSSPYLRRVQQFANGIVLSSQGIPFLHGGEEILRDKQGDHNSYKSPDSINQINWQWKVDNADIFKYYKQMISVRKATKALRLTTWDEIASCVATSRPRYGVVVHKISGCGVTDTVVIHNAADNYAYALPAGNWTVQAEKSDGSLAPRTVSGTITAEGTAVTVLTKQ